MTQVLTEEEVICCPTCTRRFVQSWNSKDAGTMRCMLHKDNKAYRDAFALHTGKRLPASKKGTDAAVAKWASIV